MSEIFCSPLQILEEGFLRKTKWLRDRHIRWHKDSRPSAPLTSTESASRAVHAYRPILNPPTHKKVPRVTAQIQDEDRQEMGGRGISGLTGRVTLDRRNKCLMDRQESPEVSTLSYYPSNGLTFMMSSRLSAPVPR